MKINSTVTLNNGNKMPIFGLGVYKSQEKTQSAILSALEAGYRLIDTAAFYGNEDLVGKAIRESGIKREEIFVTTKLWNNDQRNGNQREAYKKSAEKLGLDYIDLYLVHWPVKNKIAETWSFFEELYNKGYVKNIGVSNFLEHHIEELLKNSEIVPVVDQLELHPLGARTQLRKYLKSKNIYAQAWSPLSRGALLTNETLMEIAKKHNKSVAQVILRWDIESEILTIPKSVTPSRIIENADVFDFELDEEDIRKIDSLNIEKYEHDPDEIDF